MKTMNKWGGTKVKNFLVLSLSLMVGLNLLLVIIVTADCACPKQAFFTITDTVVNVIYRRAHRFKNLKT